MVKIAEVIAAVLKSNGDKEVLEKAKETTTAICQEFPLFQKQLVTV
jgi:glycine hydroxymethyltransferase